MKIVVDSNIVFSAILNTKGKLGQLIINGSRHFEYYTINLLYEEIKTHKEKILRLTGFDYESYEQILNVVLNNITFVDDILLSDDEIAKAFELTKDIDENDSMYIALNNHLSSNLWTGDKKLINGLRKNGYKRIKSTDEIYRVFLEKELRLRIKKR